MKGMVAYLIFGGLALGLYTIGGLSGWWKINWSSVGGSGGHGGSGSGWGGGFGGGFRGGK